MHLLRCSDGCESGEGAEYRYPFVFSFFAERRLGCLWLHECCAGNACGANDERILFVTVRPGKTDTLERSPHFGCDSQWR